MRCRAPRVLSAPGVLLHRDARRIGPGPSGQAPPHPCFLIRRSDALSHLAARPRTVRSSSGKPRRRPVPSGGWFRSEELSRFAWRFRSWLTVCSKPAFSKSANRPRTALPACPRPMPLHLAEAGLCCAFQKAAVNRPTALRLSRHLRFAGPIRGSTTRVFRYCCGHRCRIVRLQTFLHPQEVSPSGSGRFHPLDDLKLRPRSESHK